MRLALMIEGQEGVTWEHWLALARACEEHGIEALFRSDHYLSLTDAARPALDAWAVLSALAARTEQLELGSLVSPVTFRPGRRAGQLVGDGERDLGRPDHARDGHRLDGGGARGIRLPLPADGGAARALPRADRGRAAASGTGNRARG